MTTPDALAEARRRFPDIPDADGPALEQHAALLAALRESVDLDRLADTTSAMTFDPRTPTT
ncbi:hypothetical protein AB0I24_11295 [Brachybacterium paraconglomeratum]